MTDQKMQGKSVRDKTIRVSYIATWHATRRISWETIEEVSGELTRKTNHLAGWGTTELTIHQAVETSK